jgi:hypothetical protein
VYKAVHRESGEEILTLHPAWRGRSDELRRLAGEGMLVCQGCRQAVRLKAGPRKRPHFAHRHLQGCSYGQESARVLTGRALLYEWLAACCHGQVEVEVILPGLQRAADIVLHRGSEGGGDVVFWVVDALMKQQTRIDLRAVFELCGFRPVWVLLSHLLRTDPHHPSRVYLSPSERDCLRQTSYDEIGRENRLAFVDFGCSLHYLDIETARLTTFRSLERVHAPNVYTGRREESLLNLLRVDFAGELFYPGEERDLNISRTARARQVERVKKWLEPAPRAQQRELFASAPVLGEARADEPVTCIYCGESTRDWWAVWSADGKRFGKCRACLEKGFA